MARTKKEKEVKEEPLEKQLWKAADKLRKNIDAAEYKHVVLGLIFLKYISDSFEELFSKLQKGDGVYDGADPEDKDEYKAENVFFVPPEARWSFLLAKAKQPDIGKFGDAVLLPTRVKLDKPTVQPESATRNFWREWNDSVTEKDAAKNAVEAMRAQTRPNA